jgi:hypothetical protein
MENFFVNENFFSELCDFCNYEDIHSKEDAEELPDDWRVTAEKASMEPLLRLAEQDIKDWVEKLSDYYSERFPEDADNTIDRLEALLIKHIPLEKINEEMCKGYYPDGNKFDITKQDIINEL